MRAKNASFRYPAFDDEDNDFPEDEIAETLFGVAQTPEEEYLKTVLWAELNTALGELTPEQRDVFEQTELQGYSYKALAEETGVSVQTLLSRIKPCSICEHGYVISMMN